MTAGVSAWSDLPEDVKEIILGMLPARAVAMAAATCSDFARRVKLGAINAKVLTIPLGEYANFPSTLFPPAHSMWLLFVAESVPVVAFFKDSASTASWAWWQGTPTPTLSAWPDGRSKCFSNATSLHCLWPSAPVQGAAGGGREKRE